MPEGSNLFLLRLLNAALHSEPFLVVGVSLINLLISVIIERRFYQNKIVITLLTLITAFVATYFSFVYLANPAHHEPWVIVVIFLTSILLWAVFFHIAAINFGRYLSKINLGGWSALAANWVKAIDYIYLIVSTLSILRIVVTTVTTTQGITYFNALAAVLLGFAVALRITRTSIEIFAWDKIP